MSNDYNIKFGLFDQAFKLINKFIPDKDQALKLTHEIDTLAIKQAHAVVNEQLAINKIEAAHKSIFKGGWRSAVGWLCAIALSIEFILTPFVKLVSAIYGLDIEYPITDFNGLYGILMGMLGLGSLTT